MYYIREPGGELIARVDRASTHYYHFDALGSTRLITDDTGTITDKYAYDAWGTLLSHDKREGSIDQPYLYVGRLGYYTHYQEPELRLMQLGVRFYDAETGRFTQRDALSWLLKIPPYVYVGDSTVTRVDPTGFLRANFGPKRTAISVQSERSFQFLPNSDFGHAERSFQDEHLSA